MYVCIDRFMYAAREALSQSGNIINAFHITIESD